MVPEAPSSFVPSEIPIGALLRRGVDACARKHRIPSDTVVRRLETGDEQMHSAFRYEIAKGLSEYLAHLGTVFREVHLFGSAMGDSSTPFSDIDILVVVRWKRDEAIRLLRSVDLGLATGYRRFVGLNDRPASLLDIHLVDEAERLEHAGYATILDGLHTRPICLLRCSPEVTTGAPFGRRAPGRPSLGLSERG